MQATTTGDNRTGAATAEDGVRAMLEANARWAPGEPVDTTLADADRSLYILDSEAVGSIPPPVTVQGMLKTGFDKLIGERPEVLLDKLGERLAFERSGTRLYDALMCKYDTLAEEGEVPPLAVPLDAGGEDVPSTLQRIRNEEHQHFQMLTEAVRALGGDPTAQTPCADVGATASMGILQVVTDPRTTLAQSLNALLMAELADNAGWELLIALADEAGEDDLVQQFQRALAEEQEHLVTIKSWLTALVSSPTPTAAA
ncbi:MAG: ferritin-like domain-containing protein [Acidovorax sp.]|uniref:ferritin-like domain-containing protein n=1 Tax=Acidovorax sp. TaxID=1872122 RepID=UPI0025BF7F4A|nr:ferritin-like domain-containing protein [Acidovorax sp.]MCE1191304.1 ferritin-like domain-containing protein [Acidovorax sp.]